MMKYFLFLVFLSLNVFAQVDSYEKQKKQIEAVIRYLEPLCNQADKEKRKQECPDPTALESYRQQLEIINALIGGVENSAKGSGQIQAPIKTDAIDSAGADKLATKSHCDYETYPTDLVGVIKSGLIPRSEWTDDIKKNDLFTMDYRFLEKDLEKLSLFKKDLSCKVDSDCELLLVSPKICQFGSDQIVISKNDRELEKARDAVKLISEMAFNLSTKAPKSKLCPAPALEHQAVCQKCRCEIKVLEAGAGEGN